jgi:polygalacturonase
MNTIRFSLRLSDRELMKYYKGRARNVIVEDSKGMTVQFPVNILRPFVQHGGVHGVFEMTVDNHNKFVDIKKIRDL